MTRVGFEHHLQQLHDEVMAMGSMVEKAIAKSVDALKRRDFELSRRVVAEDAAIDTKRFEIEEHCIRLLATQQPMASDLRTIVSVLYIIMDLERMGDHAEGIGKINLLIGDQPLIKPLVDIPRMSELALDMLRRALDAFIKHDVDLARQVARDDDMIDTLHDQVYRELLTYMLQDTRNIAQATYLTWVTHNLERIADRNTNICERVIYTATGKMVEVNVSKY